MAKGESLYRIDLDLLGSLQPDLVLSQMLCDVCAIGYGTVAGALASLPRNEAGRMSPRLINLEPRVLGDLYANIREVAAAVDEISTEDLDARGRAEACIDGLRKRGWTAVAERASTVSTKPRTLFSNGSTRPSPPVTGRRN